MSVTCDKSGWLSRCFEPIWFFAFVPFKFAEAVLITLLPLFVVQVANGSVADVGQIHSLISLAGVVAFIVWGNLSDKFGRRRPFLIVGFLGFAVCTALLALGNGVREVAIFSTLAGFFIAAVTPVASALVLNSFPEQQWAPVFGRFYQIAGWSFVGGVLLGSAWLTLRPEALSNAQAMRSLLLFSGGFACLSFICCLLWVRESREFRKKRRFTRQLLGRLTVAAIERRAIFYPSRMMYFVLRAGWQGHLQKLVGGPLLSYYGCSGLFFFAITLVYIPLPIFLTDVLGATNSQVFLITLGKAAIEAFFYMPVGRFVQQRRGISLQAWATAARVVIFLIFTAVALMQPSAMSLIIVGVTHLFTGLTWAAINVSSTTVVAALAAKGQEGMAIGLYNSILGSATILGSVIGGLLAASFGYGACFILAAILTTVTSVVLWKLQDAMPNPTLTASQVA